MFQPTGVFHNPNDYATFLALSIPFAFGLLRYARKQWTRMLGLGSALAAFYIIVIAGSRANIVAVLLEITFLVLVLANLRQKIKVSVVTTGGLVIALLLLPGAVQEFFSEVTEQLGSISIQAKLHTGSIAVRANLGRNSLMFLYVTAGFGVGAGNAEYWMANFARYDTSGILNLHNWWLEILVNYGLFIFAGYLLFYGGLLYNIWRIWQRASDRTARMVSEALLTALVGFSVSSISSSTIIAFKPQWFLFAFSVAFLNWWRYSQVKGIP